MAAILDRKKKRGKGKKLNFEKKMCQDAEWLMPLEDTSLFSSFYSVVIIQLFN